MGGLAILGDMAEISTWLRPDGIIRKEKRF